MVQAILMRRSLLVVRFHAFCRVLLCHVTGHDAMQTDTMSCDDPVPGI